MNQRPPQPLLDGLVSARNNGAQIVGLCLGAFVLGYAGLLDGRRAATHWEFEQDFQRLFPQVRLDINALYVDDEGSSPRRAPRRRSTAACISFASASAALPPIRSPGG